MEMNGQEQPLQVGRDVAWDQSGISKVHYKKNSNFGCNQTGREMDS